jgi:DNA-directed RNA polymerase specialized sigma24 family protein
MTGSVIDGEDVVQDALIKAFEAFDRALPALQRDEIGFTPPHKVAVEVR